MERSVIRGRRSRIALRSMRATSRPRSSLWCARISKSCKGVSMSAVAETVRQKGPRVWLDMDQKELDDAYDQAVYAPNSEQVALRRNVNSKAARERLKPQRLAYGPTDIEKLDLYTTKQPN